MGVSTLPDLPPTRAMTAGAPVPPATARGERLPGTKSAALAEAAARAQRVRDVLGGIDALRARDTAAAETYLPKLSGESDAYYATRLKVAGFFNAPRRLVKAMAGMLLQRDPVVGEDAKRESADGQPAPASPALALLTDQVEAWDDHGAHLAAVARRLAERGIGAGVAGLLVDAPAVPAGARVTQADVRRLALRPYVVPVRVEQINDVRWVMWGARQVCVYLELEESEERATADGTGLETWRRFRVFAREVTRDPDTDRVTAVGAPTVQLWAQGPSATQPERVGPAIPLTKAGGGALSAIPFAPFVPGDADETDAVADHPWLTRSPIQDVIDLALTWYQVYAERRNLMFRVCTQKPWASGYVPVTKPDGTVEPFDMGPSSIALLSENGKMGFAAPSADGFEPTERELAMLEQRMAALGLAFLMAETRSAETAEGKRIDSVAQNASLAAIGRELQDCLETAIGFHCEFLGLEPVSVTVNREFERITADAPLIDALSRLVEKRQITLDTFLTLLERWSVLGDGFDRAKELEALDALGGATPAPAANGTAPAPHPLDALTAALGAAVAAAEVEAAGTTGQGAT